MFNRKQLKNESKELIRRGGGRVIGTVIIYLLIVFIIAFLMLRVEGFNTFEKQYRALLLSSQEMDMNDQTAVQSFVESYSNIIPEPTLGARVIALILSIVSGMLAIGFQWWCLKATRGNIDDSRSLFDVFNNFGRALALTLLKGVIVVIGLILLIVPGVYLALAYSQAEYILYENPELGAVDCLRRSRELMRGHIWEYFVLNLSFIGWHLLASFAASMIASTVYLSGGSMLTMVLIVDCLFLIWIQPYTGFTVAGYYNYLTGYTPEEPEQEVTE